MSPYRFASLVLVMLCVLALGCAAPALALEPAGDGWYWQSPQPQGNILNAVAFGSSTDAWAVGDAGTIVRSADGGVTWQMQSSPTGVPLGAVTFVSSTEGWAAGGDGWYSSERGDSAHGVVLHTDDGGATWGTQAALNRQAVADLAFVDAQQGWAVGGRGLILHTADGGITWVKQKSGVTRNILSVAFADAAHGYAGCAEGLILKTVDGGVTWKRVATNWLMGIDVATLAVAGDGSIWAGFGGRGCSGDFPRLGRSTNGGRTWRYADVSSTEAVWDVVARGDDLYAVGPTDSSDSVGNVSQVLVSHDDGQTWTSHVTGSASLGAIAANGEGALCAVGDLTATSVDDGATWTGRSTRGSAIGSLDMVGPTEGWAIDGPSAWLIDDLPWSGTSSATLLHTTDGARWVEAYRASGERFAGIDFADTLSGWAVGVGGLIRHTSDGGVSWQKQASGTTVDLSQVVAPTSDSAWAYGLALTRTSVVAALVRTGDAGATWASVALPKRVYPFAMSASSADRACLCGMRITAKSYAPVVLLTTDRGATWSRVALPFWSTTSTIPVAVDFVDDEHGWVVGIGLTDGSSSIAATTDGGLTWDVAASPGSFGDDVIAGLSFVDASEGWASGTGIYHTTDAGRTWTRQVAGSLETAHFVTAYDTTHAMAVGLGILSTTDVAGDTAPPVTLCDARGGWTRTGVTPTLSAADVGSSGLALTEYSVDGGVWTPGLTPPPFPAPRDHSGDGTHVLKYRSADNAGNVEGTQTLTVRIDTIKPVIRLRRCVLGRDGVLRLRLRINDKSCPSVDEYEYRIRTLRGRLIGSVSAEGDRIAANRWVTLRDKGIGDWVKAGRYRISFWAPDRAGNRPAKVGRAVLVVKPHKRHRWSRSTRAAASRGDQVLAGAGRATPASQRTGVRLSSERLVENLRRIIERLEADAR